MKFAECTCEDCDIGYKITFKDSILPYILKCPLCGSENINVHWIEHNGN